MPADAGVRWKIPASVGIFQRLSEDSTSAKMPIEDVGRSEICQRLPSADLADLESANNYIHECIYIFA